MCKNRGTWNVRVPLGNESKREDMCIECCQKCYTHKNGESALYDDGVLYNIED